MDLRPLRQEASFHQISNRSGPVPNLLPVGLGALSKSRLVGLDTNEPALLRINGCSVERVNEAGADAHCNPNQEKNACPHRFMPGLHGARELV